MTEPVKRTLMVALPLGPKPLEDLTVDELRDLVLTLFSQIERGRETFAAMAAISKGRWPHWSP